MVGQRTAAAKPSRSDEVLDADQQLKIADQIRAQFDSAAPKRATKPNRSEPDLSQADYSVVDQPNNIPELDKLRSLQSQSQVLLSSEGAVAVQDEFVGTEYYKELNSIDKQHHMTGSGFIKVMREEGGEFDGFDLRLPESHDGGVVGSMMKIRSNPATNGWIPRTDEAEA